MATKKGREQSKRETWESLKEEGNKLFSHRKYEQGNRWRQRDRKNISILLGIFVPRLGTYSRVSGND